MPVSKTIKRAWAASASDPNKVLFEMVSALQAKLCNGNANSAGLAIGTLSNLKVKIVTAINYTIDSVWKNIAAATEVAFTATTHNIPAKAGLVQEAVYLVCGDGAGAASLMMGAIATGAGAAVVPDAPAGKCVLGYCRIAVAAGATPFTANTDALNAGHLTVTYVNLDGDQIQPMTLV